MGILASNLKFCIIRHIRDASPIFWMTKLLKSDPTQFDEKNNGTINKNPYSFFDILIPGLCMTNINL